MTGVVPVSNYAVLIYGEGDKNYLLNLQSMESKQLTPSDFDELGALIYSL